MRYLLRRAWVEIDYARITLGYWLRPYDVHTDARTWRWRRTPCRPFIVDADGQLHPARRGRSPR